MISAVKHAASIRNPEFDARQRARRSTWDTPRFLYSYDETADGDLVLPRGLHPLLTELVESADSTLHVDDKRILGQPHKFTCSTPLRTVQTTALHRILEQDTGVLIAPPGTGKTVIACAAIESRATATLVLVDRKALADQWRDRISSHLSFACGQIGGGRSKTTGILDIALLPTLARRDNVEDITANYGFVIVDECHHVAASAFFGVLSRIAARYWLGLTATPERRDGLEDLIYHQLGSHHVAIEPPSTGQLPVDGFDLLTPHPVLHLHPTEFQYRGDADPTAPGGMAEIYRALVADRTRLDQIVDDVLTAAEAGANILILTTWVEHLNAITDQLRDRRKDRHCPQRRHEGSRTPPDRRPTCQPHARFGSTPDRRHQLVHWRRLRLPRSRHTVPGSANHLQEPPRAIHRSRHPSLPLEDHRNRARLPRRAHPRHRLIAEETSTRLPQDGFPRPAQDAPIELYAADRSN